ncbi:hypothetical protein BEI63_18015 [Eisenbergiella tayi]|uniref:Uncharacterized protein n=1 Tax=Eisenbergiella tayi TaxID=1432052 RepID=A0ABX3AGP7_9FIRM|nr:hypothetical protein BEI63_18015 [Eisenbergiella tayi]RJW31135.1 hypothetical protein DXC97_32605 [Lachnospiraceae bacterium TF09-5]
MFLNVPFRRESANAAKLLIQASEAPEFVRQAAKGGSLPAERNIKKHHRFFPWIRKHICGCPGRETGRRQGRAGEACGGDFFTGGRV